MRRLAAASLLLAVTLLSSERCDAQPRANSEAFPMPPVEAPAPATVVPAVAPSVGWRNSTILGLSSGLGSPYGLLGAFVGFFPLKHLQLEVGGGYSTGFGPSVAALGRVGINPGNSSFLALGIGVSTSFSDFQYAENCEYPANSATATRCTPSGVPRVAAGSASALWLNVEVSEDVRLGRAFGGRIAAGFGLLLNPGAFPAALGCPSEGLGATPCDVGASRARDEPTWLLHVRVDLYAVIVGGDP
ncbi:MAG: hypothetical protein Q8S73_29800 [Deltaproteobacteria bacterium]|nr:hypothetical protein [Myxococcales bacterium]MDP3218336.1 hypothetical protein [Deltaproteobacteria bacterium]